ncbi:scoloptoxin SSD976-like isoform X2 [Scaptodrosophila lebanonensis]|uniref:Scoloptoxin SSD976-like isoform X2 n=1 Tax=Drosophila lebanonensis TaxID=7225 RepID=A0A6J2TQW7_DROLE|nr:scoloptoxin SSD976-like isoform X2 [Scaptodrosophila lebanonensis]
MGQEWHPTRLVSPTGAWLAACPKSPAPTAVVMTSALQTEIVKGHNSRRQTLAAGALPGFSSAVRMAPVRWNAELARLAALNVRQCQMKHDACRNTPTFRASGQNLAMVGYSGAISSRSDQALVTQSLTMWWDEYKITTKAQINSYPQNYNGPAIGHFTAMAQEKQTHVGCAAARYLKTSMNYWLFACNYATTNYVNQPVYAAGPTASKCKTGTHVNFPALCKVAEVYT